MRHLGTINCEGARPTNYFNINTSRNECATIPALVHEQRVRNPDALVIQPPSVLTCAVPSDASGGLA
jgi:hypothetical protein